MPQTGGTINDVVALIGAIVGCKDLYEAITKKKNGFEKYGWEGHALTHVCGKYARYADMKCPRGTPFSVSNSRTVESMLMHVKKVMPTELVDSHITTRFDGAADFFQVQHTLLGEIIHIPRYVLCLILTKPPRTC